MRVSRSIRLLILVSATLGWGGYPAALAKTRIVLVVQEGLGFEILHAIQLGSSKPRPFPWEDASDWIQLGQTLYPRTTSSQPDGTDQLPSLVYDPIKAWNATPMEYPAGEGGLLPPFQGYHWLADSAPHPASAATCLSGGFSSFQGSINWMNYPKESGSPAATGQSLVEWASLSGLSAGFVSDMPVSHAVGSALAGIRSPVTDNREGFIDQILSTGALSLFVATGHPQYNALGQAIDTPDFHWVSQRQWKDLRTRARTFGWQTIYGDQDLIGINSSQSGTQSKRFIITEFGDTTVPDLLIGENRNLFESLQNSMRFQVHMALDFLELNPYGFLLIVHLGRLPHVLGKDEIDLALQEVSASVDLVTEADRWLREKNEPATTSLVYASLYEYGLVWGSESARFPYAQVVDRGPGKTPGIRVNHPGPTNALTPLFARGECLPGIKDRGRDEDPIYGKYLRPGELNDVLKSAKITLSLASPSLDIHTTPEAQPASPPPTQPAPTPEG